MGKDKLTMKTVEQSLLEFFYLHPNEVFASGEMQRLVWKNKNGTTATPRTVVRRLQELCELGRIQNVGSMKSAKYTLHGEPPKKRQFTYDPITKKAIEII